MHCKTQCICLCLVCNTANFQTPAILLFSKNINKNGYHNPSYFLNRKTFPKSTPCKLNNRIIKQDMTLIKLFGKVIVSGKPKAEIQIFVKFLKEIGQPILCIA